MVMISSAGKGDLPVWLVLTTPQETEKVQGWNCTRLIGTTIRSTENQGSQSGVDVRAADFGLRRA